MGRGGGSFLHDPCLYGRSLYTVKELLGHRDIRMTTRYAHLSAETLREAVQVLDDEADHVLITLKEEAKRARVTTA